MDETHPYRRRTPGHAAIAAILMMALIANVTPASSPIPKQGTDSSQIIGPDNQIPVNSAAAAWRARRHPVVRIVCSTGGCGTGFLIDDDCIMTCAHVVATAPNSSTSKPAANFTIQFGYEDSTVPYAKGTSSCADDPACAAPDNWTAASSTILSPANIKDCAILKLNLKGGKHAGKVYGHVTIREAVTVGEAVHVIGHPSGRCKEYSNDAAAKVIADPDNGTSGGGTGPGWISHGADTEPGSSGSPVFAEDGCVIAKHCGADNDHGAADPRNYAMKISAVRASVESLGCSFSVWPATVPAHSDFGILLLFLLLVTSGVMILSRRARTDVR